MNKLLKSSSTIMIGDLLTKVLSLVYLIPLAMIDSRIAVVTAYLLIPFAFFIVISNMGVSTITSVEIMNNDGSDPNAVKTSLLSGSIVILISSFIGMIVMMVFAKPIAYAVTIDEYALIIPDMIICYQIMAVGLLIYGLLTLSRMVLMARSEYSILSVTNILEQLIKIGLVVLLSYYVINVRDLVFYKSLYAVTFGTMLSMIFVLIITVYYIFKNNHHKMFFDGTSTLNKIIFKTLLVSSVIYIASSIYITIFDNVDLFFMDVILQRSGMESADIKIVSDEYFGYSLKIVMIPIQLTTNFILVMIKELVSSESAKHEFNKIIYIVLAFGLISTAGIYVVGPDLYTILTFGLTSIGLVKIQGLIVTFYILKNIMSGYLLIAENSRRILINSTIIIILSKIILLVSLGNVFGMYVFTASSVLSLIFGIIYMIVDGRECFAFDQKLLIDVCILIVKVVVITIIFSVINNYMFSVISSELIRVTVVGSALLLVLLIAVVPKEVLVKIIKR